MHPLRTAEAAVRVLVRWAARRRLHAIIDPIWKSGRIHRKALYAEISKRIGREYHTAKTRSVEECDQVERIVHDILGVTA